MKRRFLVGRIAATSLVVGLLFVLVGDRAMTATPQGIDPLEVLNLQIKPNVLIVLDTSGSMNETVLNNSIGGDHPDSKLGSAKAAMRAALVNNENKVNMMFGTYTNSGSRFSRTTVVANNDNQSRFIHWAKSSTFPSMLTTELIANQVFAYQIIGNGIAPNARTNNNKLYFTEEIGATDALCTATLTPRFYQGGAQLATEMQTAMAAATCTLAKVNTYTVAYDPTTGIFTFTRATGARTFRMEWSNTVNSIRGVLNRAVASSGNATTQTTADARIWIMRRSTTEEFTEGAPAITYYALVGGRFFNGDTFYVQANGNVCDMTAGAPSTTLPFVNLQLITGATCPAMGATYGTAVGTFSGTPVRFDTDGGFGGGWTGNTVSCTGFQIRSQLRACDNTVGQALAINTPFLEPQWQIATAAGPVPPAGIIALVPGGLTNREETVEGVGRFNTVGGNILPYGLTGDGSTPIGNSLNDLKEVFTRYYNGGGIIDPTVGTVVVPTSGQINAHVQPRERTIVLFITDGDDTCSGTGDAAARAAAIQAQTLYTPIVGGVQNPSGQYTAGTDAASSVVTYLIGYGSGAQVNRLNMIAWGGSGMRTTFASNPTAADRVLCQTCQDAYVAPDQASLAAILQAIFDQGAQTGEFTAQQSIADAIYEYVDQASTQPFPADPFDSRNPNNRYDAVTPVRFVSTFSLPGFNGTIRAYSNNGANESVMLWSAGDKLTARVVAGMTNATGCPIALSPGAVSGECRFDQLHASATDTSIGGSNAAIKRRIYTTSQNGYYGVTVDNLLASQAPFRVALWPPQTASIPSPVAPTTLAQGLFDAALGLPLDSAGAAAATEFTNLQTKFRVCMNVTGSLLPNPSTPRTNCLSGTALIRMQQARKEAREIILAFMAGATPVIDNLANPKRVASGVNSGLILYKAKPWAMAESSLATAAVVGPPIDAKPEAYVDEYELYHDGPRNGAIQNPTVLDDQIFQGFGLTSPDNDGRRQPSGNGTGATNADALKPVMSVLYAGANDMLHAFRAGPRDPLGFTRTGGVCGNEILDASTTPPQRVMSSAKSALPADCGGDELWGFVPFDQLSKLYSRVLNNPPKRDPHDYVVARGIRFSDIFIPGPKTGLNIGGTGVLKDIDGVWRKVLYFGRGIAGNYLTALDVTGPGTFRTPYLDVKLKGPIPLWSRGNPDTTDGKVGGPAVNNATDTAAYATMGQTWSLPAVGYVDKTKNLTTRNPGGVDFALYVGSGYGAAGQGTNLYTLDARTGDVIASADVEAVATANGLARPGRVGANLVAYTNAIVANPVAFNPSRFQPGTSPNPAAAKVTRVYVGDLYGRLWKMLTASPSIVIPFADLEDPAGGGAHQPLATAASLIGLPPGIPPVTPYVFVTTGNDNRENGPFKVAAFRDDGDDTDTTVGATVPANGVKSFLPAVSLFTRTFDQGPVVNSNAATPFPVFRGTAQPATSFTDADPVEAVVFFAGTRFNPPLSAFAPLPVAGNPATYPCRSTFDSILYSLQAKTGAAAYDLNASGDDAYQIHTDSRIVGIGTEAGQGGSYFTADEGLNKPGKPADPPPPPGVPGQTTTANVRPMFRPGSPMPSAKFGSTVCQ